MEVTKREILASVSIIALWLILGFIFSGRISEYQMDKNEKYNKALQIVSPNIFDYSMRTNVGNAFVYGDIEAVDPVTYPEIGDGYIYINKVKERYTEHTRRVAKTRTVNGEDETYYETETYWSWDFEKSWESTCKEVSFLEVIFPSDKMDLPVTTHIQTINEGFYVRYEYYGTPSKITGTLFTELKDNTISDCSNFYIDMDIEETLKYVTSGGEVVMFWIGWVIVLIFGIYRFYYIDNRWLE